MIAALIDGGVTDASRLLQDLARARQKPFGLDDATVERIIRVHTESLTYAQVFDEQLARWRKLALTEAQRLEVDRLSQQLSLYREGCQNLIALGQELQPKTIDAILRMSDEVGLAVLTGQLPL